MPITAHGFAVARWFCYGLQDGGALEEHQVAVLLFEILRVVAACHRRGICHGDVKPANFLMTKRLNKVGIPPCPSRSLSAPLLFARFEETSKGTTCTRWPWHLCRQGPHAVFYVQGSSAGTVLSVPLLASQGPPGVRLAPGNSWNV